MFTEEIILVGSTFKESLLPRLGNQKEKVMKYQTKSWPPEPSLLRKEAKPIDVIGASTYSFKSRVVASTYGPESLREKNPA